MYYATAVPVSLNLTGIRSFCSSEDAVIRTDPTGTLPGSEAACKGWSPVGSQGGSSSSGGSGGGGSGAGNGNSGGQGDAGGNGKGKGNGKSKGNGKGKGNGKSNSGGEGNSKGKATAALTDLRSAGNRVAAAFASDYATMMSNSQCR